jgi:protein ImuB
MHWIALQVSTLTEPGVQTTSALMCADQAQRATACIALGFTPRVALVDEAVLMEVSGSLRLFGGLLKLMALLEQCLKLFFESNTHLGQLKRAQGATSLIAIGRLRLNRLQPYNSPTLRSKTTQQRVADLPMHTLSAARPHLCVLQRIGCRTWDDLLLLPRDGVARRFGAELLTALDRARGRVPDDYEWLVLPEAFKEKVELEALATHGPELMAGFERLLARLQAWLLGRQSGLSALRLTWHLDKRRDVSPTGELEIRTASPVQDLRHISRLVSEHLAHQQLAAPVHSLTLQSLAIERLVDSSAATGSLLMQARHQGDGVVELIERLSARLGDNRVQAWQPRQDHRPEQMQHWVNARDAIKSIAICTRNAWAEEQKSPKKRITATISVPKTEALYPTWLLAEPLRLATQGNSPVYQGKLTRMAGPQRLEISGWLAPGEGRDDADEQRGNPPSMRDYYIYRSVQGSLLWVYSERLGCLSAELQLRRTWYLQGFFA